MPHITQIAAVNIDSGAQFNAYVKTKVSINPEASAVTGISIVNNVMKVKGVEVNAMSITSAAEKFIAWLDKFGNVCLVAHNGRRFDFPILVATLKNIGAFEGFPAGAFVDSMSLFRKKYPNTSLKQVDLVKSLLGETYDAHNAIEDVIALGKLVKLTNLSQKEFMAFSFFAIEYCE